MKNGKLTLRWTSSSILLALEEQKQTARMTSMLSLEKLPVELIHKILHYLHYHDIFTSVYNISPRMNDILDSYDRHFLNLQSISMSHVYLTLHHVKPERIVALTLSNMDDTAGQFQLFLSYFSIKQFVRLESLNLIQPTNPDHLNSILTDLSHLHSLFSLSIMHCQRSSVNQKTFECLTSFLNTSTSLRRLYLSGALNTLFESQFHSSIHHLYFNDNIFNMATLPVIFSRMPELKSLETSVTIDMTYGYLPNLSHLTRLTITIFVNITNADLRTLLNKMIALVHLKIVANGKQWFNGHFWEQSLPPSLRRFQFNFCTQSIHVHEQIALESFQTEFWLVNKHWHVMLDYQMHPTMVHLYSLPYCERQFYYRPSIDLSRRCRSSAPVDPSYMHHVTKLTLDFSVLVTESDSKLTSSHFFPNVAALVLSDNSYFASVQPLFTCLQSIVDLTRIVELKLGHFHYPDLIRTLHACMPRLHTLWIAETMFAKLEMLDFRHIRTLVICDCLTNVDRLCLMFPQLVHLSLRLSALDRMRRVIELLEKSIQTITFKQLNPALQEEFLTWLYKRCQKQRHFSYEIDQHLSLHIWFTDFSR